MLYICIAHVWIFFDNISCSCNIFRFTAPTLPRIIHFLGKNRDNTLALEGKFLKALTVELLESLFINLTGHVLCSAFMIGDRKLLTNAHCVEHDTQVIFLIILYSVQC